MNRIIAGTLLLTLIGESTASLNDCKDVMAYWREDLSKIREQCVPLATTGNGEAAYLLFKAVSDNARIVNPEDNSLKTEAISWLQLGAERGYSPAQVMNRPGYRGGLLV